MLQLNTTYGFDISNPICQDVVLNMVYAVLEDLQVLFLGVQPIVYEFVKECIDKYFIRVLAIVTACED